MTIYRKKKGSDTWHWCTNCPNWPTEDYDEIDVDNRPSSGELDNNCKTIEKEGNCIKK